MLKPNSIDIDISAANEGVVVGINNGTVSFLKEPTRIPSLISPVVKELGAVCINDDVADFTLDLSTFKVDEKVEYNRIIEYKEIIKEHAIYYKSCDDILNIYDDTNMGSKAKILRCVRNWYLESKGKLRLELKENQSEIEKIRSEADDLIKSVIEKMKKTILESSNITEMSYEEIEIGVICFVCYCFMKCKIMERPI